MIGIFDSGVGGLFALRELRACLPMADLLYLGDTRNLPYGEREPWELLALSRRAVARLAARGARAVLSACGTVSSVVLPVLRRECPFALYGILQPTVEATKRAPRGEVLLLATQASVQAGVLAAMIEESCSTLVTSLACPEFVTMAEAGVWQAERAASVLAPARHLRPAAVVLGCTHFSRFAAEIAALFPHAAIIDGAREAARAMAAALPPELCRGQGLCTVLTSGEDDALFAASEVIYGKDFTAGRV